MSLYPSLEGAAGPRRARAHLTPALPPPPLPRRARADLEVDTLARTQVAAALQQLSPQQALAGPPGGLYAGLGLEEFFDYGGLDISAAAVAKALPGVRGRARDRGGGGAGGA